LGHAVITLLARVGSRGLFSEQPRRGAGRSLLAGRAAGDIIVLQDD
jgi:hypothetical protein